jgi:hypothetical protein
MIRKLAFTCFAAAFCLATPHLGAQEPAPGAEATVALPPVSTVTVCIWAKCSYPTNSSYRIFSGTGENQTKAVENAKDNAKAGLPCQSPYQLIVYSKSGEIQLVACPEALVAEVPQMYRAGEQFTPVCPSGPWRVEVCCRAKSGQTFKHTATGSSFCEAYRKARNTAAAGAELEGGVCFCCWKILARPHHPCQRPCYR